MEGIILAASDWRRLLDHAERILDSDRIRDEDSQAQIPLSAWQDEFGRFRIWASDVEVYQIQANCASLDELLDGIPTVKRQVLRQLTRIQRLLGDLEEELHNPDRHDSDIGSDIEEEEDDNTDHNDSLHEIQQGDSDESGNPTTTLEAIQL
ncbi:hypothetical protein BDW74DRAFT_176065 [Aspergillus multicolor]|uniref:uncharacterized protein n=1 Tax=Aspergillus multicolor TaxID=41759 RepID=UPI003CCE3BA0